MAYKFAALVPIKMNSSRFPNKNIELLNGIPLVNYVVKSLIGSAHLDTITIYCSDSKIMNFINIDLRNKISFLQRDSDLDSDETSISDVIKSFTVQLDLDLKDVDYIILAHATSPFITSDTINCCINEIENGKHDSALAVSRIQKFMIKDGRPLNYDNTIPLPRTQDLTPVYIEQGGLYIFSKEFFKTTGNRVGMKPFFCEIDTIEALDIDYPIDLAIAERLICLK
jgi:CMP-N-acetylneuraminic acid synthetase